MRVRVPPPRPISPPGGRASIPLGDSVGRFREPLRLGARVCPARRAGIAVPETRLMALNQVDGVRRPVPYVHGAAIRLRGNRSPPLRIGHDLGGQTRPRPAERSRDRGGDRAPRRARANRPGSGRALDLNPMPDSAEHELTIGLDTHAPHLELAVAQRARPSAGLTTGPGRGAPRLPRERSRNGPAPVARVGVTQATRVRRRGRPAQRAASAAGRRASDAQRVPHWYVSFTMRR